MRTVAKYTDAAHVDRYRHSPIGLSVNRNLSPYGDTRRHHVCDAQTPGLFATVHCLGHNEFLSETRAIQGGAHVVAHVATDRSLRTCLYAINDPAGAARRCT